MLAAERDDGLQNRTIVAEQDSTSREEYGSRCHAVPIPDCIGTLRLPHAVVKHGWGADWEAVAATHGFGHWATSAIAALGRVP